MNLADVSQTERCRCVEELQRDGVTLLRGAFSDWVELARETIGLSA